MKIQKRDVSNQTWIDVDEGPWFRIISDAGEIDILDRDRMLETGHVVIRVVDGGRLELTPAASNTIGLRSSFAPASDKE